MVGTRTSKQLFGGYTQDVEGHKTFYIVDHKDSLSCELRDYHAYVLEPFSWLGLMDLIRRGEVDGYSYIVSIGDMFYETLPEE